MPDEERDVARALAQRRDADREDVEPVEEILAEAPGGDGAPQVAIGRGDEPRVDLDRRLAAHAAEAPFLQDTQQPRLQLQRHLADLVEEDRAAVRELEGAAAVAVRPGEGAAHVPEELALDELARD